MRHHGCGCAAAALSLALAVAGFQLAAIQTASVIHPPTVTTLPVTP